MKAAPLLLFALVACASSSPRDRWDDSDLVARRPPSGRDLPPGPAAASSEFRPLFFELRAPGSDRAFHLLGSIHVLDQAELPWDPEVDRAFEAAEVLAVEADTQSADAVALVTTLGLLPPGQSLEEQVSREVWDRVQRAAARHGQPVAALQRLRPWLAGILLSGLAVSRLGYSEALGVDRHFIQRAAGHKALVELEGMEVQLRLFDAMGREAEEAMLDAASRPEAELEAELLKLVAAWKRGDEAAMEAAFLEPARSSTALQGFNERLFYDRSRTMAESIAELAEQPRRLFVVVGAGHLVGRRGIPALLAERGFGVRRVEPAEPQVKK